MESTTDRVAPPTRKLRRLLIIADNPAGASEHRSPRYREVTSRLGFASHGRLKAREPSPYRIDPSAGEELQRQRTFQCWGHVREGGGCHSNELFYASMTNQSTAKLPLRAAYIFGRDKGLESEVDQIRQMAVKWPEGTLKYDTSLRCG